MVVWGLGICCRGLELSFWGRVFGYEVLGLRCEAIWGFWGLGSLYKYIRINLGKKTLSVVPRSISVITF